VTKTTKPAVEEILALLVAAKQETPSPKIDAAISLLSGLEFSDQFETQFKHKLTSLLPMATMIFDVASSSHTYISPNVEKMIGYTATEIIAMGNSFYERLYDPTELADSLATKKVLSELKDGEQDTKIVRIRHKNGEWVHTMRTVVVFERDAQGRPTSFLGVVEDLGDKLKRSLDLRRIVDSLPALIGHWDKNFKNLIANRAYESLFGKSPNEIEGLHVRDLLGEQGYKEVLPYMEGALKGEEQTFEREMVAVNGAKRQMVIKYIPDLSFGQVVGFFVIILDITKVKELRAEYERAQQKLMHSAKMSSLGEMAGGISHEINNPLTIIHGKATQLRRKVAAGLIDAAEFEKQLAKIESTAERIAKIIKGLRTFSRNAEADPMENIKVAQIIEDTITLCNERFKNRSIELTIQCDETILLQCRPSQISQIIMNLLGNAYDAVENLNEKWVTVEVTVSNARVHIGVTDSGKKIPREIAEKIMLPFFTTKEVGKGTGLGLSISKAIAESHRGNLLLDSTAENTRFILELPESQPV
jgi:PAS domain S-box-containing protein